MPDFGYSQKPKKQTIYTPQCVIDAVLEVWPEGIACDPCAGPHDVESWADETRVPAQIRAYADGDVTDGVEGWSVTGGGLGFDWPTHTFVNPPYGDLKTWLPKCVATDECMALVPVRTHRTWWRDAALQANGICWMNPLKFVGYKSTFPAPLALMYWGHRVEAFSTALAHLGDCRCL